MQVGGSGASEMVILYDENGVKPRYDMEKGLLEVFGDQRGGHFVWLLLYLVRCGKGGGC